MVGQPRQLHNDRDAATGCRSLNVFSHPEPAEGCSEKAGMGCGYCTPVVIAALSAALVLASDAYDVVLIARNPTSAWRIVVCIVVFAVTSVIGVVVLWSYYAIIFGAPGFVPRVPWTHPPRYAGPPLPPPRQGSTRSAARGAMSPAFPAPSATPSSPPRPPAAAGAAAAVAPTLQTDATSPTRSHMRSSPNPPAAAAVPAAITTLSISSATGDCANPLHPSAGALGSGGVSVVGCTEDSESATAAPLLQQQPTTAGGDGAATVYMASASAVEAAAAEARSPCPHSSNSPFPTSSGMQDAQLPAPTPASPNPYTVLTLDRTGAFRFCYKCQIYKPDNAHHCRVCRRCVHNFDHHCPFVNNCVGRNNYKLFILFLLYGGTGATLAGCLMLVTIFAVDRSEVMSKIGWLAVPILDLALGLALLLFYCQHRVLLCRGESTLEHLTDSHNDTLEGWNKCFHQPKLTPEQVAEAQRLRREKVERHHRTLLGMETPWWRRFVPIPVRTDDTADDTVPVDV